jgi:hypothetical protein
MTPDPEQSQPPSEDRSVFGNLPSARPGVRSPRRDGGKGKSQPKRAQGKGAEPRQPAGGGTKPASAGAPRAAGKPTGPPPRPAAPPPREAPSPPTRESAVPESGPSRRGVEDVAWAGVTVAAEAATLGVRLLSRALEAVRERR